MSRYFTHALLVAFAISFTIGFYLNKSSSHTIELRDGGFYPRELIVAKGSKVTFINKTTKSFWPASNPHPSHDIYSEFDAKEPIRAGKAWTFYFKTDGIYNYHDHLSPVYKGKIVVGNITGISLSKSACLKKTNNDQRTCWQNLLEDTLKKKGLDEGFRTFKELAQIAPNDCHQFAHDLGEFTYKKYVSGNKKLHAGLETSYCGYGFWHGFMGRMLKSSSFDQALGYCESSIRTVQELAVRVKENCYHGIGIGLIPDPPDEREWGKSQTLLTRALGSCDAIKNKNLRGYCYSGTFHALIDYMTEKKYNFTIDKNDPFAICFSQKEQYRKDCYFQIAPQLYGISDKDLQTTINLLGRIPDTYYQNSALLALINFTNQKNSQEEYLQFISKCKEIGVNVSSQCIPSVIVSIFNSGKPEEEYVKAVELCSSGKLSEKEKTTCFKRTITSSKQFYTSEKIRKICGIIEEKFRNVCA